MKPVSRAKVQYALWVMLPVILLQGCMDKEINFDALRASRDYSVEIARDVEILYSDSAVVRIKVTGPVMKRYVYRFRVDEEFPDGVEVTFYDRTGSAHAWLRARYAIRIPSENRIIARDSVVLYNDRGERIEAPELIWDEKEETLSTERFVKITRPDEVIYSRGFKTNQSFTEYEFYAVEGDLLIDEFQEDFTTPRDE